jgi:hypothetical protein
MGLIGELKITEVTVIFVGQIDCAIRAVPNFLSNKVCDLSLAWLI